MTKAIDRNAGNKIEIFLAALGIKINAFAFDKFLGRRGISIIDMIVFGHDGLL